MNEWFTIPMFFCCCWFIDFWMKHSSVTPTLMLHMFVSMQTQWASLFLSYKNFPSGCQWSSQHVTFNINHVLWSSAAAVGSWMWVSLDLSKSALLLLQNNLIICYKTFSFFNRCEVWNVDTASLCDCAARSTSHHHLSGLLFCGSEWTAWIRQPAGKTLEWIGMKT